MLRFHGHKKSPTGKRPPPLNKEVDIGRVFRALCIHSNTPTSLGLWLRFKHGELQQLIEYEIDPKDYHDQRFPFLNSDHNTSSFKSAYNCACFLSKYKGFELGHDTREIAIQKFKTSEDLCRETNRRMRSASGKNPRFESLLLVAQRKIADILGDLSQASTAGCGWGPGATLTLSSKHSTPVDKIREDRISVTYGCLTAIQRCISEDYHWLSARGIHAEGPVSLLSGEFQIVPGNRITTVPKNAKTDRVIACEPTGNIFIQKGLGTYIRRRLHRFGVDLNDQTINQVRSSVAYDQGYVTVDLKNASDTISKGLVETLLPLDWFLMLDLARSPEYILDKGRGRYEKWSSMGNGYTFELESLIFYSLAYAVHRSVSPSRALPSVYGDDVIVTCEGYPVFKELLEYCGFEVNSTKTHCDSGFRESCGKHYMYGVDVTPMYQKEELVEVNEVLALANRLRRYSFCKIGDFLYCDQAFRAIWNYVASATSFRFVLPLLTQSDAGLVVSTQDLECLKLPRRSFGDKYRVWVFQPKRDATSNEALLAYWMRFWPETPFNGRIGRRRSGKWAERFQRIFQVQIDAPWI